MTRDRVRLDADVYRPDAAGSFPVLLMRQPYGREIASTVVYVHPVWYAAQGFIVVIQDVRGRGTSEGEFRLFEHEISDGYDTVQWAAQLPQSNGKVGMYGFSYQGMTQLFAAQAQPPALAAIAPAMVGYHPQTDWAYENDALLLQAGLGWAIQLAAETARLEGNQTAFQALYRASRQLPLQDEIAACPEVLTQYAEDSFFHDWLTRSEDDAYWRKITPQLDAVDLPMLHIGGWFDPYLRGDMRLYREMAARSRFPQPLWLGPWGHIPWGPKVGMRDFGSHANSPIDQLQVDWFSAFLKSEVTPYVATVNLFEMGTNKWRRFSKWPQTAYQVWQLSSSGLAAMNQLDGQLKAGKLLADPDIKGQNKAANTEAMNAELNGTDVIVHDPWRPVPSLGGHAGMPSGSFDRSALDCRSDVLTYTSSPLADPLRIVGQIRLALFCKSDRPSFDLSCTLSERLPDGSVYPLTQGYGRFEALADAWTLCTLLLQPTCCCVAPGNSFRLSISAACYPAYALNAGTGAPPAKSRLLEAKVITITLQVGLSSQTHLALPLPPVSSK